MSPVSTSDELATAPGTVVGRFDPFQKWLSRPVALSPVSSSSALLLSVGLRVTAPRRAILGWLAEHPHSTADAIRRGVAERASPVSHQTVYDVLEVCVERGLVRRIEPAGASALFERRVGDNHHHLVCRECGHTSDVDCAVGSAPCLTANDDLGFVVDEAEIVFWGLCASCTARSPRRDGDAAAGRPPSSRGTDVRPEENQQ